MPAPKAKAKRKTKVIAADAPLLAILLFSTLVLLVVVLIFSLAASWSLSKNLASQNSSFYPVHGQTIVESLNYHASQAPQNFPPELLKGKLGGFFSSQELTDQKTGALKFVSFQSKVSAKTLASYYTWWLKTRAYQLAEDLERSGIYQLSAYRGKMSLDFSVQPAKAGSIVSVYQWVMK